MPAAAQATAPERSATVETVPVAAGSVGAGIDLSISALQTRLKKLQAEAPSPDDATAAAIRDYETALRQLELASEWKQRGQALLRLQHDGPRLVEKTRAEIEAWSQAPVAAVDAPRSEVEAQLAETEAKLAVVRRSLLDVDSELAKLGERRLTLPADLAAAGAERESSLGEIDLPPLPTGSVETTLASRAAELAQQKVAGEQAVALELEMATYDLRRELLTARRDLLRRKSESWAARAALLQAALTTLRAREAEQTVAEALADQVALARVHPILGRLAGENAKLTTERTGDAGLGAKVDAASRQLTSVASQLQQLEERSKGVRQKVAAAGLTDAIGLLLRKEKGQLPDLARARASVRARREEIAAVQFQTLNLEDMQKALPGVESEIEQILATQGETIASGERARIEASARNVLKTRRSYLDALIRDTNAYFATLVDLDAKENQLVRVLDEYGAFLDQHVLWVPNATIPTPGRFDDWGDAALWLVDPRNYLAAGRRLVDGATSAPVGSTAGLVLVTACVLYRRRLKHLYATIATGGRVEAVPALPAPAAVLAIGVLLALPGPFLAWMLAWMLRVAPTLPDDFSHAASVALAGLGLPLFMFEFVRRAAGKDGPAERFLDWPRTALALIRRQVVLIETVAVPAYFVAALLDAQPQDDWSETLGRTAFCFAVGTAGLAVHRLVSARRTIIGQVLRATELDWMRPLLVPAAGVPFLVAAILIGIALLGYYYSAFVLVERLWMTMMVLMVFVVSSAATLKWLQVREEAAQREEAAGEHPAEATGGEIAATAPSRVSAQTRSLLRVVFVLALLVGLFSVWVDVFPALRFFEKVELWQTTAMVEKTIGSGEAARLETVPVQVPVTVANLLIALLGALLAIVGARNLPGLIELVVLSRMKLDRGLRYAIATVTRYAVFIVGAAAVLKNLGVEWSNVQWLVAAISVGLGFGLQEIFGNFVSGLILLFERPVRIGDTVTIDGINGVVMRIEMRATTILDGDRKELIVPNKELITGRLVNWSLHDPTVRVVVPVGVAYGSDTAAVERVLLECAKQCATVLEQPPPLVVMTKLAERSLDFELRVFVVHPEYIEPTRHALLVSIERKLRAAAIEIPFAQRDVVLRSVTPQAAATLGLGAEAAAPPASPSGKETRG